MFIYLAAFCVPNSQVIRLLKQTLIKRTSYHYQQYTHQNLGYIWFLLHILEGRVSKNIIEGIINT